MSENVELTKKQADALVSTIEFHKNFIVAKGEPQLDGKSSIVDDHARMIRDSLVKDGRASWGSNSAPLNDLSLDQIITALYVGYDIQPQTAGEILLEKYQSATGWYQQGMREALEVLGAKVVGINC